MNTDRDTEQNGATLRTILFALAAKTIAKGKHRKALEWLKVAARPDDYLLGLYEDLCSAEYEERMISAPAIVEKNAALIRLILDDAEIEFTNPELAAFHGVASRDLKAAGLPFTPWPPFKLCGIDFYIEE